MLQAVLKLALPLAATVLVACGGVDSPEPVTVLPPQEQPVQEAPSPVPLTPQQQYEALLNEASQAKAEAEANAANGPCTADEQCSTLTFRDPLPPCYFTSILDYSTASPTAALASAAADRYAVAALAAEAIAPPPNIIASCVSQPEVRPLACIQGSCQRGFSF